MDEHASNRHTTGIEPDLAAIVLADARARSARGGAGSADGSRRPHPELAPVVLRTAPYDARSALVLAIVVAAMAAVVGWFTAGGRDQVPTPPSTQPVERRGTTLGAGVHGPVRADEGPGTLAADSAQPPAPAPRGVDVAVGRVTASRSGAGGGIVRIAVANQGSDALDASAGGLQVSVLLDGVPVGERVLGAVPAAGTAATELSLDSCPSGRHALVVVLDPRGLVAEVDERDNASSRMVSFGC